jgi:hypothetical protein
MGAAIASRPLPRNLCAQTEHVIMTKALPCLDDLSTDSLARFLARPGWRGAIKSCCGIHLWRNIDGGSFVFTDWRECALDFLFECGVTYEEATKALAGHAA